MSRLWLLRMKLGFAKTSRLSLPTKQGRAGEAASKGSLERGLAGQRGRPSAPCCARQEQSRLRPASSARSPPVGGLFKVRLLGWWS